MSILINNLQGKLPVDEETTKLIQKVVGVGLELEGVPPEEVEVSIGLVDDERMKELNSRYRGKDAPTDVLSFPMDEHAREEGIRLLGDIVISLERARAQAVEWGHSFEREVARLASHGLLHLLGYDHETVEEEARMRGREDAIIRACGL